MQTHYCIYRTPNPEPQQPLGMRRCPTVEREPGRQLIVQSLQRSGDQHEQEERSGPGIGVQGTRTQNYPASPPHTPNSFLTLCNNSHQVCRNCLV